MASGALSLGFLVAAVALPPRHAAPVRRSGVQTRTGVLASIAWQITLGVFVATILVGGTFMG